MGKASYDHAWTFVLSGARRAYKAQNRAARTKKVFGIGFHKTATSSLALALRVLGYRVTGPNGVNDPDISQKVHTMADELISRFDAFQDNPWPLLYRELDAKVPGSKFVLTVRPADRWIKSVVRHFGSESTPMRTWIYGVGSPLGNEDTYVARYERHNREVLDYFKDRPDDLLVMRIAEGDGWEKLCPFLGLNPPPCPFPHVNKSTTRESFIGRLLGWIPKT
jgi:hypothetical protein